MQQHRRQDVIGGPLSGWKGVNDVAKNVLDGSIHARIPTLPIVPTLRHHVADMCLQFSARGGRQGEKRSPSEMLC